MGDMILVMKMLRTYSELIKLKTFDERFEYLKLGGTVGDITFGFDRYLNQSFYHSREWKAIRREIIIRDDGNDLGIDGYSIESVIHVHHMNPMMVHDLLDDIDKILNPEYLICTSPRTHKAIHYSNKDILCKDPVVRFPGDTKLW